MKNKKLTKEQFIATLIFLSRYVGMDDLYDKEMQEELWEDYEDEKEKIPI